METGSWDRDGQDQIHLECRDRSTRMAEINKMNSKDAQRYEYMSNELPRGSLLDLGGTWISLFFF